MTTAFLSQNSGVDILLTVVATLVAVALCVYLFFRIKRDRLRAESLFDGDSINAEQLGDYVNKQIKLAGRHKLLLFRIDICDYESLYRAIGETQYENYVKEQILRLSKVHPWGVRIVRMKDDCFYVCIRNADSLDVEKMCRLVLNAVARTVNLSAECSFESQVNVACAVYPDAGADYGELSKNLDIAMLGAKRKGRDTYLIYSSTLSNIESREYKFYEEIHSAIRNKEFVLYYQPIVRADTLEVVAGETLLRWENKTKGILLPADFMYVMEKTGDIIWAGYWGFEELAKQLSVWTENYEQKFAVSHNISARQLQEPGLADQFKKIASKHHSPTKYFVMEITDMSLYFSSATAKENIDKFAQYGFNIAIDGFGSNFTSIHELEKIPVNMIKLDRSFWEKGEDSGITQSLLNALISYAKAKNVSIVAMRVDKAEEINILSQMGIDLMQGYLFSKPAPAKQFIGDVVLTPWTDDIKREAEYTVADEAENRATETQAAAADGSEDGQAEISAEKQTTEKQTVRKRKANKTETQTADGQAAETETTASLQTETDKQATENQRTEEQSTAKKKSK